MEVDGAIRIYPREEYNEWSEKRDTGNYTRVEDANWGHTKNFERKLKTLREEEEEQKKTEEIEEKLVDVRTYIQYSYLLTYLQNT